MRVISGALAAPGPGISAKEPRMSAGSPPRFAANRLHLQQKAGARPVARSGWAQFHSGCKSAANAARRRPRPVSCASVARRKYPEQRDALRQREAGRGEDRFRGGQREIGGAVAAVIGAEQRKQCLVLVDGYELAVERRPSVGAKIESKCRDLSDEGLNLGSRSR